MINMEISKRYLWLVVFAVSLLASCQKAPVNGDLDGQWQLQSVTADGVTAVADGLYLRIQLDVAQLAHGGEVVATGNMEYNGSTLKIDFPYVITQADLQSLAPWGVYDNPVVFHMEELTSKRLVMTSGDVRVVCVKF